uniref:Large ribosomal subunit protein uL22c n=1 Tax=Nitzschia sp. PL1-4 TaxID=2083272 RepID=A0A2Z5ZB17_9STRA|nr:hypothetical protein orf117 [Nitzschia sp. PL1-4]
MYKLQEVKAISKYIRISPHKVRRVTSLIQGCSYEESLMILKFLPYKAVKPIYKVVDSAVNNAKSIYNLNKNRFYIYKIFVNEGPKLKRIRIQSRGRTHKILKPTCHITVIVKSYNKNY